MKTKPLTFLLALTFLFLFSGSSEVDSNDASVQISLEEKLKELNSLKEKNLINDEEYNKKKEKLLEEL